MSTVPWSCCRTTTRVQNVQRGQQPSTASKMKQQGGTTRRHGRCAPSMSVCLSVCMSACLSVYPPPPPSLSLSPLSLTRARSLSLPMPCQLPAGAPKKPCLSPGRTVIQAGSGQLHAPCFMPVPCRNRHCPVLPNTNRCRTRRIGRGTLLVRQWKHSIYWTARNVHRYHTLCRQFTGVVLCEQFMGAVLC